MISSESGYYIGCEIVINAICGSAIKNTCESVLESIVSEYENHFDVRRNLGSEQAINEEFEIAKNGPSNLATCDDLLKEALDLYWKGKPWHFYKVSDINRLKYKYNSQVIHRLEQEKNMKPYLT